MKFSKTELKVLWQVALGRRHVSEIGSELKKDSSQVYRIVKNLEKKGFAVLKKGVVTPSPFTHVNLLIQQLSKWPNLVDNLSGYGMNILLTLLEPKTVNQVITETRLKRSTVFSKIKQARGISLLRRSEGTYTLNLKVWPQMGEFFTELKKYEEVIDKRIPPGASIYYKNEKEIVFSTKTEWDAALTGFSAYERFGIKLLTIDYTYYLPKKEVSKKEVFLHSLYRAEKEGDTGEFILIALFYTKYRNDLKGIRHPIINNINKVLEGEKVQGYPDLSEIADRAEMYDIKI